MPTPANPTALAQQARRSYAERLLGGMPAIVQAVDQGAKLLAASVAEPALAMKRRELLPVLQVALPMWLQGMAQVLRGAVSNGLVSATRLGDLPLPAAPNKLSLVDDDTIEHEILSSRLALAMMDRASWEFTDLRSRMNVLEGRDELDPNDILRPHVFARIVTSAWLSAPLTLDAWRTLQSVLHDEFSHFAEEAYHETNRFLIERKVLPEVDLRPFIRRTSHGRTDGGASTVLGSGIADSRPGARGGPIRSEVGEETRMMTRAAGLAHGPDQPEAIVGRLNRLIARQLPEFVDTSRARPPPSPRLNAAIAEAQEGLARRVGAAEQGMVGTPQLLDELQQRKNALKQAAATPVERATIEIVALLFQSILTEDAIPATVRVWFARLQMPVLRVAVSEPDFFATVDHPARRLIDRMGSCVMGFDSGTRVVGDLLEKEIKRVVQVVEAYPDTGRRVFQTVLGEFEKFLEHYFRNENEASRKGVSLAQQVEQRETMAIQFTIELRKMLNEVPVQEGIRDFLFHVWADVLATTAVKSGLQSDATKDMKRAAADLIWSASAKVSRAERAEVIRRLPPLLKTLRDGMDEAGIPIPKQDEHIQRLNSSLAAAFTAKTAAISHERLDELMNRLETLEELLPEAEDVEIDESLVLDLSGHESSELEVVAEGGSMPTPAMLAWARELQVGSWYMLDYRNRNEAVQLAWQGLRRQLTLFVSPQGRGVLFQQHRLAAFLQAGLLVPAQDESLTVKATRSAMAKLDSDPSRLVS
ncbi:DUF1631 family protein [Piscinibacter koreensis]|uniref:DUF1631 family protein n=1 Tax=Piscinibacter koreensis TaxID=2742824 RepID=A0A7Y6NNH5_9BURK|nr:DUF1631 family protein [Schlegelella koreensis]NUZ06432.1 DUF1631 family protein [Schlegelella koreensis]